MRARTFLGAPLFVAALSGAYSDVVHAQTMCPPECAGQTVTADNLSHQDLTNANFTGATIVGAKFIRANLTGAKFDNAKFQGIAGAPRRRRRISVSPISPTRALPGRSFWRRPT